MASVVPAREGDGETATGKTDPATTVADKDDVPGPKRSCGSTLALALEAAFGLADLMTDIQVTNSLEREGHTWWFGLTMALVFLPFLISAWGLWVFARGREGGHLPRWLASAPPAALLALPWLDCLALGHGISPSCAPAGWAHFLPGYGASRLAVGAAFEDAPMALLQAYILTQDRTLGLEPFWVALSLAMSAVGLGRGARRAWQESQALGVPFAGHWVKRIASPAP